VAALPDGGFAVVWVSQLQDGYRDGIYGQRFDAEGTPVGEECQVSEAMGNIGQQAPEIIAFADGAKFVGWRAVPGDSENSAAMTGRGYEAEGKALSAPFRLSDTPAPNEDDLSLVVLGPSSFAASWTDWGAPCLASTPWFLKI
jgi:hypothetical protein